MALRATGIVIGYDGQSDNTIRTRLDLYSGEFNAQGVLADPFSTGTSAADVNTGLVAFIRSYAETEWGVLFGLSDLIKLVNPHTASIVSASGSAVYRIGIYMLPWEAFRLKLR